MTVAAWTYGALLAPAAFVGVRLVAAGDRPHDPRRTRAAGTWAARFGIVVATAIAVAVAVDGAASTGTLGIDGVGLSLRIDPLSAAMLLMISLLAAAIVRFSGTYLEGDERHGVFLGRLAATVACVEILVLAGNLGLLVAAWIATSLALRALPGGVRLVLPPGSAEEAALVPDAQVWRARHLLDVVQAFLPPGAEPPAPSEGWAVLQAQPPRSPTGGPDLADVKGQTAARRALEIAAAGGHGLLMVGPPGSGKSMLAQRLPGLLPPMALAPPSLKKRSVSVAELVDSHRSGALPAA